MYESISRNGVLIPQNGIGASSHDQRINPLRQNWFHVVQNEEIPVNFQIQVPDFPNEHFYRYVAETSLVVCNGVSVASHRATSTETTKIHCGSNRFSQMKMETADATTDLMFYDCGKESVRSQGTVDIEQHCQ